MADTEGGMLAGAYTVGTPEEAQALYDSWAATYEQELLANGYVTPERCAAALAGAGADPSKPVLDVGCGTGLAGAAFHKQGFTVIDGTDFSAQMLAVAAKKPGVYRNLIQADVTRPFPGNPGDYAAIAAVGVLTPGHAPAEMVVQALDHLPQAGLFVFSVNDHAAREGGYSEAVAAACDNGIADQVFDVYGDHIPGTGMKARVVVLKKR